MVCPAAAFIIIIGKFAPVNFLHETRTGAMARKIGSIMIPIARKWPFRHPMAAVILLVAASAAAQQVTLERDSPLHAEPRLESAPLAQLKRGATGEVLARQGGWLQIRTPEAIGWLFSFNVRFPPQKAEAAEGGAGPALGRVFGPRRSVSVTSTIGVRGLEEEDLKQARFDAGQLKQLEGYAVTRQTAEEAARAAGLAPAKVEYLDAKR